MDKTNKKSYSKRSSKPATGPWRPMTEAPKVCESHKEILLAWDGGGLYSVGEWMGDCCAGEGKGGWSILGIDQMCEDSDFQAWAEIYASE
jgi:hypothetical protein